MTIDFFEDWQVGMVCLAYASAAWIIQEYRVVPPRDWLLERIADLKAKIASSTWCRGPQILANLKILERGVRRFWLYLPTSKVQAGWRQVHAIEDDHILELPAEQVKARLVSIRDELCRSGKEQAKDLAGRINALLVSEEPPRGTLGRIRQHLRACPSPATERALLREAAIFRHNENDSNYEELASLLGKGVWLTVLALAFVSGLAVAFDREQLFLLGAAGGLISRLSRVLRQRPAASEYGAAWSTLLLSPATGALFGWVGVLVVQALATSPIAVLDERFAEIWSDPSGAISLALALLFGFSERLFNRLLKAAEDQYAGHVEPAK